MISEKRKKFTEHVRNKVKEEIMNKNRKLANEMDDENFIIEC